MSEEHALVCETSGHPVGARWGIFDFSPPGSPHAFGPWVTRLYDTLLVRWHQPRLFGVSYRELVEFHVQAMGLARGGTILDVPCGSGLFSIGAAAQAGVRHYLGVDISLPMLQVARKRCTRYGLEPTLTRAELCALPLAAESVDVVICSLGLQFIERREEALREMRRVLRPGGWLLGVAPALGLHPRYDRRHARRARKDFPVAPAELGAELELARFVLDEPLRTQGALVFWKAQAFQAGACSSRSERTAARRGE
ncbi:class I SAM-dependent methyltransferase [Stigmatella sp. ncwal1]|uniref:Class I SAM-dependent methyltransferase n=1 Tax=Stigmatella ashevillensis TaxID=2995309 RepID=A0ABT5DP64_9BACT|nr:class I SAM-dependent methyltransferase [Stigmatella ashevillena]MDC0714167.1 class I SAM-dependent methyltransferase [Stigmatella ashevillena]